MQFYRRTKNPVPLGQGSSFFEDYNDKRVVASCSGLGLTVGDDVKSAAGEALELFPLD
jgi:hypothetical protein